MSTTKKLSARYAALGTRFRNRVRTDPFYLARFQIMGLYFIAGVAIFVITGWYLGYSARQPLYQVALTQNGNAVQEQINVLEERLVLDRFVMLILFAIAAYLLTDYVLRPIRKSAELQRHFIAMVSHELRTPVTIMKNASEVALRKGNLSQEKAVEIIKSNLEETNRLSSTIQFLLTLSTLQARRDQLGMVPISLSAIAKDTVARLHDPAYERQVTILLEAPADALIEGNATAIEGLLVNLLKNALAHTPTNNTIYISITEQPEHIRLSVRDTGSGIEKKDLPYIFEPFYQGENGQSEDHAQKGAGLGLALVKAVAELHKATISIVTGKGTGTTMVVQFPRKR